MANTELQLKRIEDRGDASEGWRDGFLTGWMRLGVGVLPFEKLKAYLKEQNDISNVQFDFNKAYGDAPADMALLASRPDITAVKCDAWYQDSNAISQLTTLKSFRDHVFDRKGLDWEALERLEDLGLYDCHGTSHPKYEKFLNLKSLSTSHLPSRYKSFDAFCGPEIVLLSVRRSPLASLNGLEAIPGLRELHLEGCRKLSADGLSSDLTDLRHVRLFNCPKLTNFDFVRHLPKLETLEIEGLGEIESFEPLRGHPTLSSISGIIRKGARLPRSVAQNIPNLEFVSPAIVDTSN